MAKETIMDAPQGQNRGFVAKAVLVAALIAVTGFAIYTYVQNVQLKQNPQIAAQTEVKSILAKVSKLIVLPEDETPTIATVTDPELLKEQPFFAKAQKGDKVLIYTKARKAILYRPDANKIIEVAPINIGAAEGTTTAPKQNNTATQEESTTP